MAVRNKKTSKVKSVGTKNSKSLLGRINPIQRRTAKQAAAKTTKPSKASALTEKQKEINENGFTVVNGKLVSSNDVGVLLRKTAQMISQRKEQLQKTQQAKTQQQNNSGAKITKNLIKIARAEKTINNNATLITKKTKVQPKKATLAPQINNKQRKNSVRNTQFPNNNGSKFNQLVFSTQVSAANKILVLYNLALGVKQDNLKSIIQKLSSAVISKVRVRDLPSGSATASVWLHEPSMEELERVRSLFDGALVDGRTIQVLITSDSSSKLAY